MKCTPMIVHSRMPRCLSLWWLSATIKGTWAFSLGVSFACRVSSSGIDGAHPSQSKTHLRDFQRLSARCVTIKYVGNNTRVVSQLCICNLIYACIYWYRMHLTLRWKASRRKPTAVSLMQFTHCTP